MATHGDRARGTTCLLMVLFVLVVAAALPARAAADPTATCTTPTATVVSCASWFTTDVLVHWDVADCPDQMITADTPGQVVSCTTTDAGGTTTTTDVTIKRDTSPPVVGAGQAARVPDDNGWYTRPVEIGFTGTDAVSGLGACPPVTFAGPDTAAGSVVGTCTDVAGNIGSSPAFALKYDATPPAVTAAVPDRPPDFHGWYTAPVTFGFTGTDATSGLAACASARYAGPDSGTAGVVGKCTDNAGNSASHMFLLKYDATPPPVLDLRAVAGDRRVAVHWTTTPDVTTVQVLRIPGLGTAAGSIVFRGPGSSFVDTNVDNGVTYAYGVDLRDAAGNEGSDVVRATPKLPTADPLPGTGPPVPGPVPHGARLRFPLAGAVVSALRPPMLRWTRVRHARYYNVQLHRAGRKLLSAWPTRPRYRLHRHWSFGGKARRLSPGRYVWYVWPGYGRRSAARYGGLIGSSAFRVGRGH